MSVLQVLMQLTRSSQPAGPAESAAGEVTPGMSKLKRGVSYADLSLLLVSPLWHRFGSGSRWEFELPVHAECVRRVALASIHQLS